MNFISVHKENNTYWKILLGGQGLAILPDAIVHFSGNVSKCSTKPILAMVDPKLRKLLSKLVYFEPTEPFSPAEIGVLGSYLTIIDLELVRNKSIMVRKEFVIGLTGNLLTKCSHPEAKFDEMMVLAAADQESSCEPHAKERSLVILNTQTPIIKQVLGERTPLIFCPPDLVGMSQDCTIDKFPTTKLWGMKRIKGPGEVYFSNFTASGNALKRSPMFNRNRVPTPKLCILAAVMGIILAFFLVLSDALIGVYFMQD